MFLRQRLKTSLHHYRKIRPVKWYRSSSASSSILLHIEYTGTYRYITCTSQRPLINYLPNNTILDRSAPNPSTKDKILDHSNSKDFAGEKINVT